MQSGLIFWISTAFCPPPHPTSRILEPEGIMSIKSDLSKSMKLVTAGAINLSYMKDSTELYGFVNNFRTIVLLL